MLLKRFTNPLDFTINLASVAEVQIQPSGENSSINTNDAIHANRF
jgi:hypothetical protein